MPDPDDLLRLPPEVCMADLKVHVHVARHFDVIDNDPAQATSMASCQLTVHLHGFHRFAAALQAGGTPLLRDPPCDDAGWHLQMADRDIGIVETREAR